MEARYNVYFAGQLLEGQDLASVRDRMAKLFNADAATLDKLFSGSAQLVKRDCDKDTALKYKQAIERAGALPVIKTVNAETTEKGAKASTRAMTAAERIAALASAPDLGVQRKATEAPVSEAAEQAPGAIHLAPAGTAVLLPGERHGPSQSEITIPDLEVDTSGQRLSTPRQAPPPPPDTSHLSEAAVGELLPNLPSSAAAVSPDTSAINLTPEGTDFSDCAGPQPEPPALDLSAIALAPAGADVLEQQYRKKHDVPPPPTDHLALEK